MTEECSYKFSFPYEPYDIQLKFMQALNKTIQEKKIGVFESPTGTGKSLSLICGSLSWLLDFEKERKLRYEKLCKNQTVSTGTDWLASWREKLEKDEENKQFQEEMESLEKMEERLKKVKVGLANESNWSKLRDKKRKQARIDDSQSLENDLNCDMDGEDADIAPAEYLSDDEKIGETATSEEQSETTKIFYCSRTHSQLAQFLRELKKTRLASEIRVVSLGSRLNLCVNDSVRRLTSLHLINDRCLELQKSSGNKSLRCSGDMGKSRERRPRARCPFNSGEAIEELSDRMLVEGLDMEEAGRAGQKSNACPYYASRRAVAAAHLVLLPYQILLHEEARKASGVRLSGNVVIVDEAHNLLDSLSAIYAVQLTAQQLSVAQRLLRGYADRFRNRLKAKNLVYVRQLLGVLDCLLGVLPGSSASQSSVQVLKVVDFLFLAKLADVNMFKLLNYIRGSQLAKKMHGYALRFGTATPTHKATAAAPVVGIRKLLSGESKNDCARNLENVSQISQSSESVASPFLQVVSFLERLTFPMEDGRVVVERTEKSGRLKFLLLNPGTRLHSVVWEARAVVLAGGTMEPAEELMEALQTAPDRLFRFSCGHVIQKEQLVAMAVCAGPGGSRTPLRFDFGSRSQPATLRELSQLLLNVLRLVPGGVVVFFASYDYEQLVFDWLTQSGVIAKLREKKSLFREPKQSSKVEEVLTAYSKAIERTGGAVLMAVVGGKLSEGINFSDELGRCIIMVGLPYPNKTSPELCAKLKWLEEKGGSGRSQRHYESLCMQAVNQSIGRAIRHRNDFAAILLVDERYGQQGVQNGLPQWIRASLVKNDSFAAVVSGLKQFFNYQNRFKAQ